MAFNIASTSSVAHRNIGARTANVALPKAFTVNTRRNSYRLRAKDDEAQKGVLPFLASWPPKPITEHGQPKPEDDPQNYDVISGERTGGPSEGELEKKKEERNKDRPFSNPDREGGTQIGGGGEGSAS